MATPTRTTPTKPGTPHPVVTNGDASEPNPDIIPTNTNISNETPHEERTWTYAPGETGDVDHHIKETVSETGINRKNIGRFQDNYKEDLKTIRDNGAPREGRSRVSDALPTRDITNEDNQARATIQGRAKRERKEQRDVQEIGVAQSHGSTIGQLEHHHPQYEMKYYVPGSKGQPGALDARRAQQKIQSQYRGDADYSEGNPFYEPDTEHFIDNNPYRTTTKEADDFIHKAAADLVGDTPGQVEIDDDGNVTAFPRTNEKRVKTQARLGQLSSTLLKTYDNLNLNTKTYRYAEDDHSNLNAGDQVKLNDKTQYENIAKSMDYLNVGDKNKWTGTIKFTNDQSLKLQTGTEEEDHTLYKEGLSQEEKEIQDVALGNRLKESGDGIMTEKSDEQDSPFYFDPLLSDFKIKVADKKSAVALSYTLRQYFDLQVLYYKKHVEILQVFQLLVIFFEKYNYSINALMYVLEHLIKAKLVPKEGDPESEENNNNNNSDTDSEVIQVPIPIDFTKSVIKMLDDQKKMMNVVAGFKSHLGMDKGGLRRDGDKVVQEDENQFLDGRHPGVYRNIINQTHSSAMPASWIPRFYPKDDKELISHVGLNNKILFPSSTGSQIAGGSFNTPNNQILKSFPFILGYVLYTLMLRNKSTYSGKNQIPDFNNYTESQAKFLYDYFVKNFEKVHDLVQQSPDITFDGTSLIGYPEPDNLQSVLKAMAILYKDTTTNEAKMFIGSEGKQNAKYVWNHFIAHVRDYLNRVGPGDIIPMNRDGKTVDEIALAEKPDLEGIADLVLRQKEYHPEIIVAAAQKKN